MLANFHTKDSNLIWNVSHMPVDGASTVDDGVGTENFMAVTRSARCAVPQSLIPLARHSRCGRPKHAIASLQCAGSASPVTFKFRAKYIFPIGESSSPSVQAYDDRRFIKLEAPLTTSQCSFEGGVDVDLFTDRKSGSLSNYTLQKLVTIFIMMHSTVGGLEQDFYGQYAQVLMLRGVCAKLSRTTSRTLPTCHWCYPTQP